MPVWVLRVRQGLSITICGVDADDIERSTEAVRFIKDGQTVWSGPSAQVLAVQDCADRTEAHALMRHWGRSGSAKGALGPEFVGIRPSAGGSRQVGGVVERVSAVLSEPKPR